RERHPSLRLTSIDQQNDITYNLLAKLRDRNCQAEGA
ncbi:uncharacterized protein METZ01_LOCUS380980, partial [marine metagenome]